MRAVARILILGGGCRGRQLASELVGEGQAVRITTRTEAGRAAIEQVGAECWVGTPDRLATLRGSLAGVTVICWLLGSATGAPGELIALHTTRLRLYLTQAIDTTVRGLVYEAAGTSTPAATLADGESVVREVAGASRIPVQWLRVPPGDDAWAGEARAAVAAILEGRAH
jgi:hypothetical protein